jgi:hypothetical protein
MKVFTTHWSFCLALLVLPGSAQVAAVELADRPQNLEEVFQDSGIDAGLHSALISKNADRARATFEETRKACMACHTAEKLALINHSTVFERVKTFAPVAR